jgi:hypothetical protein
LDLDVRFSALVKDLEGEVFDIGLHFIVGEFTTNETLSVEDTAKRVISALIE